MTFPKFRWLFAVVAVGASACPAVDVSLPTPLDRFYFPTAITHLDGPDGGNGVLVVASTNFDKRFSAGSLIAVNLDALPLPAFGATPTSPVTQIPVIRTTPLEADGGAPDAVRIAAFAGQMAALPLSNDRVRLFVATRSEKQRVHAVDLTIGNTGALTLTCLNSNERDCSLNATSLNGFEQTETGIPRAPGAFGVALRARTCSKAEECGASRDGGSYECTQNRCLATFDGRPQEPVSDVMVTHISQADTPLGSAKDPRGYLVKLGSESMTVSERNFVNLSTGASHAIAVGARWNYVSGRFISPLGNLIRLVDRASWDSDSPTVVSTQVESVFRVAEARGIALSADEKRVYLLGRSPDALLVASIDDPGSDAPKLSVVRGIPLPAEPNEIVVLSRPGMADLLAITCTAAGVIALYDDQNDVLTQVPGVGIQPFGLAADRRGAGARLYATNFQDGRVAVIDLPDLATPQSARVVAHLGRQQLCLVRSTDVSCATDGGVAP
ncbi:MAG: hypothetical protein GQE15_30485 [Archangiaceae bacterium]|nr:hypothetical protein [Archangiaceae bacterium]